MNIEDIIFISKNKENGSVYVLYKIKANRSISPKSERKANEVIIVGYPHDKIPQAIKKLIN